MFPKSFALTFKTSVQESQMLTRMIFFVVMVSLISLKVRIANQAKSANSMHRRPQLLVHFLKCTELKPTTNLPGKTINIYLRKILSTPLPVPLHARTYTVTRALLNTILKQTKQGCGTRKTFNRFDSGSREPNRLRPCLPLRLHLRAKYPSDFGGSSSKPFPSGNFVRFQRR